MDQKLAQNKNEPRRFIKLAWQSFCTSENDMPMEKIVVDKLQHVQSFVVEGFFEANLAMLFEPTPAQQGFDDITSRFVIGVRELVVFRPSASTSHLRMKGPSLHARLGQRQYSTTAPLGHECLQV